MFYKALSQDLARQFESGAFLKDGPPKADKPSAPPNPLSDPAAMEGMMGGMKTQAVMMVPQMVIMGWINFFFQGFVLSECPLPRIPVSDAQYHNSQAPVSAYTRLQIDVAARGGDAGHGRPLGLLPVMVLPQLLRPQRPLPAATWRRQL